MAESVRGRWGRSNNETVRRRAHNGGGEEEIEVWLDHVQLVICRSRDYDITLSNYDAHEKYVFDHILGLIIPEEQALLLYTQFVKMNLYNYVHLLRYNVSCILIWANTK